MRRLLFLVVIVLATVAAVPSAGAQAGGRTPWVGPIQCDVWFPLPDGTFRCGPQFGETATFQVGMIGNLGDPWTMQWVCDGTVVDTRYQTVTAVPVTVDNRPWFTEPWTGYCTADVYWTWNLAPGHFLGSLVLDPTS